MDKKRVTVQTSVAGWAADSDAALREALVALAQRHGLTHLLAHADDGVVWGRYDAAAGAWAFSGEAFTGLPALRARTVQQCRVFGPRAELYAWREGGTLRTRLLREVEAPDGTPLPCFDRPQLLWGDGTGGAPQNDFTLLREGAQGLRHAVPLVLTAADVRADRRVALIVRHYVDYDDEHRAYVRYSRMVGLRAPSRPKEANDASQA